MLEKLLESLDKEVFTAEMVDSLIVQFNESVEEKAKEIADAQLAEAVEKALAEAKEANEIAIQEAVEAKTAEIEEKATSFVEDKIAEINESLDLYLGKVVDEFIAESKEKLNESLKAEKADMIIEAFESMLSMGAMDVMKIAEAKDQSYADAKLTESVQKYDELMTEHLSLKKENIELIKTGIISEMKEGLSLVESKKFETLAAMLPFSRDEKYVKELEVIKESVIGAVEKPQVIVESVKDSKKSIYSHLV